MRSWSFFAPLLLAGCVQIIDLEERKLPATEGDAGSSASAAPDCAKYCRDAKELCTQDAGTQLFQSDETCMAVCAKYAQDPSPTGNTLACRQGQLDKLRGAPFEALTYCSGAGPGGGAAPGEADSAACGTNCQGFCALRQATCSPEVVEPDCERKCLALTDPGGFNAAADFGSGVDTVQCRIAHLSAAILYESQGKLGDRNNHCKHSGIRSEAQCDFKENRQIDCAGYCKIVGSVCTGDAQIYESNDQCLKTCAKLDSGSSTDKTAVATRRCIREGAYDALTIGRNLCATASPASDRCGRGKCESYCLLAQKTCGLQFDAAFKGNLQTCEATCSVLPGATVNAPYSVTLDQAQRGPNFQCRLLRLTRALEGSLDPKTCEAALGGGPCGP